MQPPFEKTAIAYRAIAFFTARDEKDLPVRMEPSTFEALRPHPQEEEAVATLSQPV